MKPPPFEYHAPDTAKDAVDLLADLGEGAKVIAGGQSLVPVLAMRLAAMDHLVDIRRVPGLRGVEHEMGGVWIGAATTQAHIGRSPLVAAAVPMLALATPLIGHFQIRNRGTLGGSLAHADPAAEYPAVALALDAVIETLSPRGQRAIPAREFFTGIWSTALEPDELITGVMFPPGPLGHGFAVEEFARRPGDFAVAGAAVAVEASEDGTRVTRCGIGLFGLGPTPLRAAEAEALVTGAAITAVDAAEAGRAAVADLREVPSDGHGSAAYRRRVGAAIVAAAVGKACVAAREGWEAVNG